MAVKKLNITNYINTNFREYAIYTLMNRGIPGFYDSLTNVQRLILLNTPLKSVKTLTVVGDVIKDGYHHGDGALSKAINRLARPFDCAEPLLIGDSFFGSQINEEAASPRYTSVCLNEKIDKIIKKYSFLNKKDEHDIYTKLNVDFPIGLLLPLMGIAVGYRTMILPRHPKHIEEYLEDKRKTLKPYFAEFKGKIDKYNNLENSWLLEGEVVVDDKQLTIHIKSLPPLLKYDSFIKKLGKILNDVDFKLTNNSTTVIDILIKINGIDLDKWTGIKDRIIKSTKLIFKESLVFIKEKQVLEYDTIEDYLEDFKIKNHFLKKEEMTYYIGIYNEELEYLEAKLKFLLWMSVQKKTKAHLSESEIVSFLSKFPTKIARRLDEIKLRKLNDDEVKKTEDSIIEYKNKIKDTKLSLNQYDKFLKTLSLKLHTKNKTTINLFEETKKEIDDIEVFSIEENEEIIDEIEEIED